MTKGNADHLAFGATVVAALLWFTAFVALFRRDLGDPYVAASLFAAGGSVVWLAGRLIASKSRTHRNQRREPQGAVENADSRDR